MSDRYVDHAAEVTVVVEMVVRIEHDAPGVRKHDLVEHLKKNQELLGNLSSVFNKSFGQVNMDTLGWLDENTGYAATDVLDVTVERIVSVERTTDE